MSNKINSVQHPAFYYPVRKEEPLPRTEHLSKRVTLVALPFFSLCEYTQRPSILIRNIFRIELNGTNFFSALARSDIKNISYQFLNISLAIAAFAGNVFAHRSGFIITVGHDFFMATVTLLESLQEGNEAMVLESFAKMLNSSLSLAAFLTGGIGFSIASLCMLIMLNIHNSDKEFKKENFLEMTGNLLMVIARSFQLAGKVQLLIIK